MSEHEHGPGGPPEGSHPGPYPGPPPDGAQPPAAPWQPPAQWQPPSHWAPPHGGPQQPQQPQAYGAPPYAGQSHQPMPAFPHPEPRPYHQMLRTWNYAAWRPMVGFLLVVVGFFVVMPLLMLPLLAGAVAIEGGDFGTKFVDALTLKTVDPAALLYINLVLGSMILVTWFVMRVIHRMRPRWLASVRPRLRWKFLFACLGLAVVALVAQAIVGTFVPGNDEGIGGHLNHFTASSLALGAVVLLTTPLQAAGEEYVFRGYTMQAIGSLFRVKWVAIVASALLFGLAHGAQNPPLFFDRFFFGLVAAWLVTKTGGLEAGIAMHVLNNFLAFGVAIAFGDLTASLTVNQVSWWNIVVTLTQQGVYAVLVLLLARKMNLQTRTQPPVEPPSGRAPQDVHTVPSGA
ncbi:MAG: CPBP family intramembrane glutamic endopeptidase [Nocardioidaceae bacterium]